MNIVVEKQPHCIAILRADAPAEKVQSLRKQVLRTFSNKARLPGFRPGKAPLALIEKRFDKDIEQEVLQQLAQEAIDEALKQDGLNVLEIETPDAPTINHDGTFSLVSKLILAPEFSLPEYKGLKITVPPAEVPDADLQEQLANLQERLADFQNVEGRAAVMGDLLVIDYSSKVDGLPTEEFLGKPAGFVAGREDFWLRLSEESFLPGFAAQLVDLNVGESREVTITIPDDFPLADLRQKEMAFAVLVKEIKEIILPELNDALAERLVPGKSLAELTDLIRSNLTIERKRKIQELKVSQLLEHFNRESNFELPEHLVTQETQLEADHMVKRGVNAGVSDNEIEIRQQEIFAAAGDQAVKNLRSNFILQEIARSENIEVSDSELFAHLAQMAQSRNITIKRLVRELKQEGALRPIRNSLLAGKAVDFAIAQAEIVESAEMALTES